MTPRLQVCQVSMTGNGSLMYVAGASFLFKKEGWRGVFQPFEIPSEAVALFDAGPPGEVAEPPIRAKGMRFPG